ncbi:hypothetical protein BDV95DRAFT_312454 [Massariosphaeria phaeospora]|uniref:Uncharacterized protein n=1 Tax=Massariosphaeria phaeospora TaxID=100035 RepID=A0A7C8IIQ5_9PLEO|nr:hypothetical protein BDV95DRAFT_312454 [Massariosphaeria phaeospora]
MQTQRQTHATPSIFECSSLGSVRRPGACCPVSVCTCAVVDGWRRLSELGTSCRGRPVDGSFWTSASRPRPVAGAAGGFLTDLMKFGKKHAAPWELTRSWGKSDSLFHAARRVGIPSRCACSTSTGIRQLLPHDQPTVQGPSCHWRSDFSILLSMLSPDFSYLHHNLSHIRPSIFLQLLLLMSSSTHHARVCLRGIYGQQGLHATVPAQSPQ